MIGEKEMIILQQVGVPIYLQVKNYILDKINSGEISPGAKIPTERQLSLELKISRNTVSAAYKTLLDEGIIEARQGKGTFVKKRLDNPADISGSRRERALKYIDQAIAQVVELGFTVEQFAAIAAIRAKEKAFAVKKLRVAVVDCTLDYIQRFAAQITQLVNVQVESIVLDDILQGKVPVDLLHSCDWIVTTVAHQNILTKLIGTGKVIAVSTVPNLEAVIKLAKLPVSTEVGIVAETVEFSEALDKLLQQTNIISGLKLECLLATEEEILQKYVKRYKTIVVSPAREILIRRIASYGHDIIPFCYEIDKGSLQKVLARLIAQTV